MTQENTIESILQDSEYDLSLFSKEAISDLEARVSQKSPGKYFVRCIVRDKEIQLKPEEIVRQLYAEQLIDKYGYPKSHLVFEFPITMGSSKKSADIIIRNQDRMDTPYIIIEIKKPKSKDGKDQLRSYCNATGAEIGVWTNGHQIAYYHREYPSFFQPITKIPRASQKLADIIDDDFTLRTLFVEDELANKRKSLKEIIKEMENDVLANAGVDVFEEVFKLIFAKLYDEYSSRDDKVTIERHLEKNPDLKGLDDDDFRHMEFRKRGQTYKQLERRIKDLFDAAKEKWPGVFAKGAAIEVTDNNLSVCVSHLQDVKLFNSNLMVVDEAFEYLISKSAKGEKGQYFTPRHVIDMCVKMLNPKRREYMIDTAAGSCGFPVHTIFKLTGNLFTGTKISPKDKEDVLRIFGIDFDEKAVRVARTLNLIAGDGETNVLHLNALDFNRWSDKTENDRKWISTYGKGFERLEKLRVEKNENQKFNFDIVMANPPFAGDIKDSRILSYYYLGYKASEKKPQDKVARDVLFIERNLDFLKPGGRMAIVLPQGRLNNFLDKYVREYIADRCRILAVVGLHGNTFKPHTGTKTSVLFVQKWDDELCPKREDYEIFFATSEKGGKNTSGDYIYCTDDKKQYKLDSNRHRIVDHDLHNHDGASKDGIAEAFIDWARNEKLSFCG